MTSGLYFTVTLVLLAWLSASTCTATSHNHTTANMTTSHMTTATVAPPLVYNTTVAELQSPLTNEGCGSVRLCAAEPSNCNPASGSCTLIGTKQKSGANFEFVLAGESSGYLAVVLSFGSTLGGGDTSYVCFKENGSIAFTGGILNGGVLTKQNVSANNVKGKLDGNKIQCTFDATVSNPNARISGVTLGVVSGTVNSNGTFGTANTLIKTNPLDLTNPNQTVSNTVSAGTTSSPMVTNTTTNATSNAMAFRQTLAQALMISAGVMGLTLL